MQELSNLYTLLAYLRNARLDVSDKVKLLHNAAKDVPVVIVTCGPSLASMPKEEIIKLKSKCVLIAIKQAHTFLEGNETFHLINQYNLRKYSYSRRSNPYVIACVNQYKKGYQIRSHTDLLVPYDKSFMLPPEKSLASRLAVNCNFDDYLLIKTLERPWGPGIILELAIYLAVHLGTRHITLVSYDLHDPKRKVERLPKYDDTFLTKIDLWLTNRIRTSRNPIRKRYDSIRYFFGFPYNTITESLSPDENEILVESSYALYTWLQNMNIMLSVCSNSSYVSESIPRISVQEVGYV